MCYSTEQTVAGLLVLLADRAASVGLWDLHIGPWWFKLSEARRCHWLSVRACGAGENVFHARGDRRQEGAPREPGRGDRRRAVLDSFEQLQIDFQAKHICIRKTVLQAIWVSCGMCSLNRWIIFLELSCRNFSPLIWDLGHYSACFVFIAHEDSSGQTAVFDEIKYMTGQRWMKDILEMYSNNFREFMH